MHLHTHTHIGSILDGVGSPTEYAKLASKYNQKACAITDHGRMGGLLEFQKQMKKEGIKPILGCEFYWCDELIKLDNDEKRIRTKNNHIILLASDKIGYQNILRLNWLSMQDDHFYYMPRITHDEIKKYSDHVVMGTACMASKLGRLILSDDPNYEVAEILFKEYLDIFKDNMYGEIQLNELSIQKTYNDFIINMCNKYSVPICITGDVHYANKGDETLQTLSIMVARKQTIDDMASEKFFDIEAKNLFFTNEHHIKTFNKDWSYGYSEDFIDSCLKNTDFIADKISFEFEPRTQIYIPAFEDKEKILQEKIKQGIKDIFGNSFTREYADRLKREYEVIKNANLIDYFLIVEDYHKYAREVLKDFACLGRGSGVASLILYLLKVTALDPIKHNLMFERFLTAIRAKKDFPDIDSDFSPRNKLKVQDYLVEKYGADKVFHICTYTTYGLKMAAKDIMRIYKIDYSKSNDFSKELDNDLSWEENLMNMKENRFQLHSFYEENKLILDMAPRFNDKVRNMGVHAGGLVILSKPIYELIPVERISGVITTAFQESGAVQELDSLGIIKFDLLGLNTLGIIKDTISSICKTEEENVEFTKSLYNLDLTDENIYKEVNNANKYNLFQMCGSAYQQIATKVIPSNWEEINACNSMARPGTINFLDDYINGKKGIKKYNEKINEILKDTYSICLFQEQAMEIFHKIGGFSLEEADYVRGIMKRLSKKDKKEEDLVKWDEIIAKFSDNASKLGISKKEVDIITEDLMGFSSYSFNKAHASVYTYIGVITAYLSYYYRTDFYCASLNNETATEKIAIGINNSKLNNIKILPPDINNSDFLFSKKSEKEIIFGLTGIKYAGEKAIELIEKLRPFSSFKDFLTNPGIRDRAITSRVIQSLIYAGCFDSFGELNRKFLIQVVNIFWVKRKTYKDREKLEEVYDESYKEAKSLPGVITTESDKEVWEKEYLGYNFFTTKFVEEVYEKLNSKNIKYLNAVSELSESPRLFLCETTNLRIFNDKNGNEMCFAILTDFLGSSFKIPFFKDAWKAVKNTIKENALFLIVLRRDNEQILFGSKKYNTLEEYKKMVFSIN